MVIQIRKSVKYRKSDAMRTLEARYLKSNAKFKKDDFKTKINRLEKQDGNIS